MNTHEHIDVAQRSNSKRVQKNNLSYFKSWEERDSYDPFKEQRERVLSEAKGVNNNE